MFHSIRSKLILAVVIMAALLGLLIYFSSAALGDVASTLDDLQNLQEFYSHTIIPQKDMNQFIGAIDNTALFVELGDEEAANEAFFVTADAEMDISAEFASLEQGGNGDLAEASRQAHLDWEIATEYMKIYAEAVAAETGMTLERPSTDPTKTVDAHTTDGIETAQSEYGSMSVSELEAVADDNEINPVEIADESIDGLAEATTEALAEENSVGDAAVKSASQTILYGSAAVLLAIILIGLIAAAAVSRPLVMLKEGATAIAAGNLDYRFKDVPADEVGSVIHSVQAMSSSLKSRILNLEEVAGVVMLTGDDIESAAAAIEPKGPEVQTILDKAKTLKDLVGQALQATKK